MRRSSPRVRGKGGLIGVAVDPLTAHECGNSRYMAIPWLDACLSVRLPKNSGDPMNAMPTKGAWLAPLLGTEAVSCREICRRCEQGRLAAERGHRKAWMQFVKDTQIPDTTPPPAPTNVRVNGSELAWDAEADLESGLGQLHHRARRRGNRHMCPNSEESLRPSDLPRPAIQRHAQSNPLVKMTFTDTKPPRRARSTPIA
jgi:hypothetical protein